MDKETLAKLLLSAVPQQDSNNPLEMLRSIIMSIINRQQQAQQGERSGMQAIASTPDNGTLFSYPGESNFKIPNDLLSLVTQRFGQRSKYDVFSGGVNNGVDFAVPQGTPVTLPEGKWKIIDASTGSRNGYIGNKENRGYGNSIYAQNTETGEKIRLSHLNQVYAKSGQELQGGTKVGLTGKTGNTTGAHLDAEYYNKAGQMADILRTNYPQQILQRLKGNI